MKKSESENSFPNTELKTKKEKESYEEKNSLSEKDSTYWSLYENGKRLKPLKFSNGKTQENIVKEVVDLIKKGKTMIFIHGTCGTGKSAIALNIARQLGRASIVVPIKTLQKQYEEDYTKKKYLLKENGKKMKIAMISGRENHDSVFLPGVSCADQFLPDTIRITEKNFSKIKEYYEKNPLIKNKLENPDVRYLKRISIAPANPYWSPIVSALYDLKQLSDAKRKKYTGLLGRDFIFYHRKEGCSYYDQYQAYIDADVIIFNSAKYKIETILNRKPATDVEIIDEADEFLDSFSNQEELNLTRLARSLTHLSLEEEKAKKTRDSIIELLNLEEKNKRALGIDEDKIFKIKDTNLYKILIMLLENTEINIEISLDEINYGNHAIKVAEQFKDFLDDTYVSFRKNEDSLYASFASSNISQLFKEMILKNKAFVFMSATIHSAEVLKNIFGIEEFYIVEAENLNQGSIEIHRTGKEFDCKYENFKRGKKTRKEYLESLKTCIDKAKRPVLIHVNAFEDLPTEEEAKKLSINNIPSRNYLKEQQSKDKNGEIIIKFKNKEIKELFTTKCSRGVDFPGEICNSIIFTKYPNPNINSIFWRILQETHKDFFWEFYKDKARRELLQRIYRAIRSKEDHVYILSPDSRVLDAVRDIQLSILKTKNQNYKRIT